MRLVPADYVSEEDQAMQSILDAHPVLKWHLALLLNGYSELCEMCVDDMHTGKLDPADVTLSLYKENTTMLRYGIPLFETMEDWEEARKHLREARAC